MWCSACGNQLEPDAKFCDRCGAPVVAGPEAIPPEAFEPQNTFGTFKDTPKTEPYYSAPPIGPAPSGSGKKIGIYVGVTVAALALLGVGLWFLLRDSDTKEPALSTKHSSSESGTALPDETEDIPDLPAETPAGPSGAGAPVAEPKPKSGTDVIPTEPAEPEEPGIPAETPPLTGEIWDDQPEEPEPVVPATLVLNVDMNTVAQYVDGNARGATWSLALMDLNTGTLNGTSNMETPLSSSALLDIPVLYTVAALNEDGQLSLDAMVPITTYTSGRTQLGSMVGQSLSVRELLRYMLQYSDNIAANTLLQYLGFTTINQTCADHGYSSVSLNNYILQTTDYTNNDNYVSCADLCAMLCELYNDNFSGVGRSFLQSYMTIRDATARTGLGAHAAQSVAFLNLNGQKTDKYNEVVIVDDGAQAYAIAFMGSRAPMNNLTAAAASCGQYLYQTLEIS